MANTIRPIFSLLLGLLFMIIGHGTLMTLVPLRAAAEGWAAFQIGAIGSAYYIGFVAGCVGAPYLITRVGHIRAFMVLIGAVTATTIAFPLWVAFPSWFVLRALFGACLAGLYMIVESWLNDRASNENRGVLMSAYIMVNYAALAIGQVMVTLEAPTSFTLFALATITLSIAAIPLALTRQSQPAPVALARFRPVVLYRRSPVGLIGVSGSGMASGAFWSLGAVAAVGAGMTAANAAVFMGIVTAAGAIAQWPIGRFSDRIDRRVVLIAILIAAAFFGLLFAFLPLPKEGWYVLAALFGAAIAPTYSVAAAHAYDHAPKEATVETAAGLFIASASGSIIGPLIAATMMSHYGAPSLFLFTSIVQGLLAIYVFIRIRVRPAPAKALKQDFDLATATPAGGPLPPEEPAATAPPPPDEGGAHPDIAGEASDSQPSDGVTKEP